jgi:hypothetical protein
VITKEMAQALQFKEIVHAGDNCTHRFIRYRVNGACKTWKKQPNRFRVPLKYFADKYWEITELNADSFHRQCDCPVLNRHPQSTLLFQGEGIAVTA